MINVKERRLKNTTKFTQIDKIGKFAEKKQKNKMNPKIDCCTFI